MTVYCLYIFNRYGECLLYRVYKRTYAPRDPGDEQKNMYGMLFAMRNFCQKMSPAQAAESDGKGLTQREVQAHLQYYVAGNYALHYFETPTGLRFIMTTGTQFTGFDVNQCLRRIHARLYVEYVVSNALYTPGEPIQSALFLEKLDAYVKALPIYE
ncbi:Trafficking protein particle complex subunit 1 [Porphyridium purpureum]|uniref:Trafficking protein particle complex subunit n=1 Tax=Porphyridium purpureum TaxID=35688 RepID=A0A5J4Z4Q3_PORPP|nr:Trafficking protein particle complex subunit 1 [Porphyridium purpureum]|eukprot:POR0673..scf295_1